MENEPIQDLKQRLRLQNQSSSALICLPFLDTDVSLDKAVADEILRERGYSYFSIAALRKMARVGLFLQVIDWEWAHLDLWDVLFGYALLGIGLGIVAIGAGMFFLPFLLKLGGGSLILGIMGVATCKVAWLRNW